MRYCFIAALVLYWPFIFFLAHVPQVPTWVLRTQMSDKTLHYLGYLMLVFLWWFSIFPFQKPSIVRFPFWLTLAMIAVYGVLDEWLQSFTHRTPDIWDWAADVSGVITGLIIFGVVGIRLSALAVTAFVIFVLTSLCKADPLGFVPLIDILFYVGAYCLITVLWMGFLVKRMNISRVKFFLLSVLLPVLLLAITSIVASIMRKHFAADRLAAAVAGIILGIIVSSIAYFFTSTPKSAD